MGKRTNSAKRPYKKSPKKQGTGGRNWLYLIFSAAMVLVIGLGSVLVFGGGSPRPQAEPQPQSPAPAVSLPSWIERASLQVREAYVYAAEHPETISYIPCYCGCGQHDGHRSANDCFVAKRGADGSAVAYDPHGAGCDMCVDIALMTKNMLGKGNTLAAVRKAVEAKYSYLGPSTNTPPIPQ